MILTAGVSQRILAPVSLAHLERNRSADDDAIMKSHFHKCVGAAWLRSCSTRLAYVLGQTCLNRDRLWRGNAAKRPDFQAKFDDHYGWDDHYGGWVLDYQKTAQVMRIED